MINEIILNIIYILINIQKEKMQKFKMNIFSLDVEQ